MSLRGESARGMAWTAAGKIAVKGLQFAIGIVLARLLTPADFGLVGIVAAFIAVSETFVDCGFSLALMRKLDRTDEDASTVFWFSLGVAAACYLVLFAAAPAIAAFFGMPELATITRVVAAGLVFGAMASVPQALLRVNLRFAAQSAVLFASVAVSAAVGVALAWRGFGAWALVWQGLAWHVVNLALLVAVTRWLPRLAFSRSSFRSFFSFGWRHLCSSAVNAVCYHVYTFATGRFFGAAATGAFARAASWTAIGPQFVQETMINVNYPLLAERQNSPRELLRAYERLSALSLLLLVPALALLAVFAEPVVRVVLGEQWLVCVPYLRILAAGAAFEPAQCLFQNLLYVRGRTDTVLKLEAVEKPVVLALVFAAVPFGLGWLCAAKSAATIFMAAVNYAAARRECRIREGGEG